MAHLKLFLIALLILANAYVFSQKRYEVKSGKLVMTSQVFAIEQEMTTVFDDFGALERTDIEGEIMGIKTHSLQIRKDGYYYTIDLNNSTGIKTKIVDENTPKNINFSNLSERMIEDLQIEQIGTEEYMGKLCEVWALDHKEMKMKGKYHVWNGISLKTEMEISGMKIFMNTKHIDTDFEISKDFFKIPENIIIKTE